MTDLRHRRFTICAGVPGSGKSTFISNVIKRYDANVLLHKHLSNIEDPAFSYLPEKNMSNWQQGVIPGNPVKCKMAGVNKRKDYPKFLDWTIQHYRNGMLIIDDAGNFERDRPSELMLHVVSMRRHLGIDVMLVYHGLSLIPIEFFPFVNNIVLFNTVDNFDYKANKLPCISALNAGIVQAKNNFNNPATKYTPAIIKVY